MFRTTLLTVCSEVSVEFRFPSSGLTKLNYTSHFPSPPLATSAEQLYRIHSRPDGSPQSPRVSSSVQSELETGWYYYLADIAARRILQRVIQSFYETSESTWLNTPLQDLLHTSEELDRQLTEWYVTFYPYPIRHPLFCCEVSHLSIGTPPSLQ